MDSEKMLWFGIKICIACAVGYMLYKVFFFTKHEDLGLTDEVLERTSEQRSWRSKRAHVEIKEPYDDSKDH